MSKAKPLTALEALASMQQQVADLVFAIEEIERRWDRGDLSEAVRDASAIANRARSLIAHQVEEPLQQLVAAGQRFIDAYAKGEAEGGSVEWSDLDDVHESIASALDAVMVRQNGETIEIARQLALQFAEGENE